MTTATAIPEWLQVGSELFIKHSTCCRRAPFPGRVTHIDQPAGTVTVHSTVERYLLEDPDKRVERTDLYRLDTDGQWTYLHTTGTQSVTYTLHHRDGSTGLEQRYCDALQDVLDTAEYAAHLTDPAQFDKAVTTANEAFAALRIILTLEPNGMP